MNRRGVRPRPGRDVAGGVKADRLRQSRKLSAGKGNGPRAMNCSAVRHRQSVEIVVQQILEVLLATGAELGFAQFALHEAVEFLESDLSFLDVATEA